MELVKRFGVAALLGVLIGSGLVVVVSPKTDPGAGLVFLVGVALTIVLAEGIRTVFGRKRKARGKC